MPVTIANRETSAERVTLVYEFFDSRVLGHLWFIAMSDGISVQLLAPTFSSREAAHLFERCVLEFPTGALLTIDSQLELARRIEDYLAGQAPGPEPPFENLLAGLALEKQAQ